MDDSESKLLVIPASHSAPQATLLGALAPPAAAASEPIVRSLALQPGLFDPLPLPSHIDDWLAQYREAPQTVRDLMQGQRARPTANRTVLYLQPLALARRGGGGGGGGGSGGGSAASEEADQRLFEGLRDYLGAFFLGTPVVLQPMLRVPIERGRGRVLGKEVCYREYCPANEEAQPQGQLDAGMLLEALKPRMTRGTTKGGALPDDGFAVLGVTTTDLYSSDEDVFTGGLACLTSRAGVFSFYRYGEGGGSGRVDEGVVLWRACKTAAHEILHNYGLGHCLHRHCLMNGCGHLLEDFAAPPYLCPVCLGKLKAVQPQCQLMPRYRALLDFCEARPSGFEAQAEWLRRAIAVGGAESGGSSGAGGSSSGSASPRGGEKRPAAKMASPTSSGDDSPSLLKRVRARMGLDLD